MKEVISEVKEIFNKFKHLYSTKEIENLIYDSLIVFSLTKINPSWESDKKSFLDFKYEKIIEIINTDIYNYLKEILSMEEIEEDILIPTVYESVVRNQQRERFGIYYTPQWLVKYVVDNSVGKQINKMKSIDSLKILEPACGAGMFLIYVFDVLYNWYVNNTDLSKEDIIKKIIEKNLYGIDIDCRALKLCKYILYIKVFKIIKKNINIQFNLYNSDYLGRCFLNKTNFHFIIGNPPYLENRRINKYFDKQDLKNRYITAVGRFDIYSLFIEKSLQIIEKRGIIAFILPCNLLTNNNFSTTRELILKKTDILEIINLGDGIFQGVNMNMAIIMFRRSSVKGEHFIRCKNLSASLNIQNSISKSQYKLIPQVYFNNMIKNTFDINSSEVTFNLREKVFKRGYNKINDVCEIIAGIATGNIRNKLLTTNSRTPNAKKVLEGKNIDSYYHKWGSLYFIDDKSVINKSNGEYATFMKKEFIKEEKILVRQTADKFICTYDDEGYYLLNTLYSLKVRKDYKSKINIKYVLGLLNSKLYNFLYRSIVEERGKLFPQVKIFHIQNSPIVIPEKGLQNYIIKRVDKIIAVKKFINENNDLNIEKHCELTKELYRLIYEVDSFVYNLYNLNCEEIEEIDKSSWFY